MAVHMITAKIKSPKNREAKAAITAVMILARLTMLDVYKMLPHMNNNPKASKG